MAQDKNYLKQRFARTGAEPTAEDFANLIDAIPDALNVDAVAGQAADRLKGDQDFIAEVSPKTANDLSAPSQDTILTTIGTKNVIQGVQDDYNEKIGIVSAQASTSIVGVADPSTVPVDTTDKFRKYSVKVAGIYSNFLDVNGAPIEVVAADPANSIEGDLDSGIVELWGQNNIWTKNIQKISLQAYAKTSDVVLQANVHITEASKNIYDYSQNVPNEAPSFNTGEVIEVQRYIRSPWTEVKPDQQYTLQGLNVESEKVLIVKDASGTTLQKFKITAVPFTFTTSIYAANCVFTVRTPGDSESDYRLIQLEEGGVATDVQPFAKSFIDKINNKPVAAGNINLQPYAKSSDVVLRSGIGLTDGSKNIYNLSGNIPYEVPSFNDGEVIEVASPNYVRSPWIDIEPNKAYTLQGLNMESVKVLLVKDAFGTTLQKFQIASMPFTFTASEVAAKCVFSVRVPTDSIPDYGLIQFEQNNTATEVVPFKKQFIHQIDSKELTAANVPDIKIQKGKNLFDKSAIIKNKILQISTGLIIDSVASQITDKCYVSELSSYVIQGLSIPPNKQLFACSADGTVLQKLTIDTMPFIFTTVASVAYVQFTIKTNNSDPLNLNLIQLELGVTPTEVSEYVPVKIVSINNTVIDNKVVNAPPSVPINFNRFSGAFRRLKDVWVRYLGYGMTADKPFRFKMFGNSVFGKFDKTGLGPVNPMTYPPGIVTNALAAYLWRAANGMEQPAYARYDLPGVFTEITGTFSTVVDDPNWNDHTVRPTETRLSTADQAGVAYRFTAEYNYLNFIDRTDTSGCTNVVIQISEGDGLVEVRLKDSDDWVEANGFSFSQLNLPAGAYNGNSIYGRRIYTRKTATGKGQELNVSVSKGITDGSRFLYWGIEQMTGNSGYIEFTDCARGGHRLDALVRYFADDVRDNPDLIFFELPLINEYLHDNTIEYILQHVQDYIFGDRPGFENEYALKKLSDNWTKFKVVFLIPQYTQANYKADGTMQVSSNGTHAKMYYNAVKGFMMSHDDVDIIDMQEIRDEAIKADTGFLNPFLALAASGTDGDTYNFDTVHSNDKGTKAVADGLCPIFSVPSF